MQKKKNNNLKGLDFARAMNQNNNHKHVKKVGTPHNFCLIFTGELEKQLFIKKLLKWDNKKCKNFNIYNLVFFLKKKNT